MINGNFIKLLLSYFLSTGGDWLYRLAIPILVYQKTLSPFSMSIAYALLFMPFLIVTPFGGVIADRFNRRTLLVWSDFFTFIFIFFLAILESNFFSLFIVYILLFIISSFSSFYHTVFHSLLPSIVLREELAKANSFISGAESIINILGPIFGGGIIGLLGVSKSLYLNAAFFLFSTLILLSFNIKDNKIIFIKITFDLVIKDMKDGFRYAWQHPIVKYGCILFIFSNFAINMFYANFIFYLVSMLNLTPSQVGLTISIIGFGAAIGSLLAPLIGFYLSEGKLILVCTLITGLSSTLLLFAHHYVEIAIIWGFVSFLNSIIIVTYFTLRQKVVPYEFLGRTIATTRWISYLAIPASSLFSGLLLQQTRSMSPLIIICAIILTINGLIGWVTPLGKNNFKLDT